MLLVPPPPSFPTPSCDLSQRLGTIESIVVSDHLESNARLEFRTDAQGRISPPQHAPKGSSVVAQKERQLLLKAAATEKEGRQNKQLDCNAHLVQTAATADAVPSPEPATTPAADRGVLTALRAVAQPDPAVFSAIRHARTDLLPGDEDWDPDSEGYGCMPNKCQSRYGIPHDDRAVGAAPLPQKCATPHRPKTDPQNRHSAQCPLWAHASPAPTGGGGAHPGMMRMPLQQALYGPNMALWVLDLIPSAPTTDSNS